MNAGLGRGRRAALLADVVGLVLLTTMALWGGAALALFPLAFLALVVRAFSVRPAGLVVRLVLVLAVVEALLLRAYLARETEWTQLAEPFALAAIATLVFLGARGKDHACPAASRGELPAPVVVVQDVTRPTAAEDRAAHPGPPGALPDRAALLEGLAAAVLAVSTGQEGAALLGLHLDGAKTVIDRLGPGAGEQLLTAVAGRLSAVLRPGTLAVRLGGHDFAVLLRGLSSGHEAAEVAQRLLRRLREPLSLASDIVEVSASIRVAIALPGDRRSAEQLLHDAGVAMSAVEPGARGGQARFA